MTKTKSVTVTVHDQNGVVIFLGAVNGDDEYVRLRHQVDQPSLLECRVSDLSASLEEPR